MEAVRPDDQRDPAGRDRLLRRDEQHGEPRHGARRRARLRQAARARCRVWAGVSGGGVWRTDNALGDESGLEAAQARQDLDQNSVGDLTLDPTDKKGNTIYLGTGEGNRCSSGCEAGVGIYKSTNGGNNWTKLDDACVSNATYPCVDPGQGRVPRPRDQRDRGRPAQREPHLRRLGAGRSRPLARHRQRRHDPHRAGRERARALRVDRRRRDLHRGLGRRQARRRSAVVRHHRRRARPARTRTSSTRRRSTRASGGATPVRRRPRSRRCFAPQFNQGARHRPGDVRPDGQERAHAGLPDRGHAARDGRRQRSAGRQLLADRHGGPAGGDAARVAGRPRARRRIRRRTRSRRPTPAGSA